MNKENVEQTFKNILDGLSEGIKKERMEKYKDIVMDKSFNENDFKNVDDFHFNIVHPFDSFLDALIRQHVADDNNIVFLLKNSRFVETMFRRIIEDVEGSACCADKSRFLLNSLIRFFKHGDEIQFDLNQEYTFHIPKLVLNNHDSVLAYFKAVQSLFYGSYKKFMIELKCIMEVSKAHKDSMERENKEDA